MDSRTRLYNTLMGNPSQMGSYNAIGRTAGLSASGSDPNFFQKRWNSIENALSSTIAAPVSFIKDNLQNAKTDRLLNEGRKSMQDIVKGYGYDDENAFWDAKNASDAELFKKYGYDINDYDARWADAYQKSLKGGISNETDEMRALKAERQAVIDRMSAEDVDTTRRFDEIQDRLRGQGSQNASAIKKSNDEYKDWVDNNYLSQKLKQDRGKFLGSAINTLSTATDLLGLTAGPISNAIQGGIEGVADELEQNGLDNFSLERAGQNALTGAASGAVVGGLNKGLNNALAKRGGQLLKGGNRLTQGINNFNQNTGVGRLASAVGMGAARGAASGAVGGATGAGLSAAMNGQDIIGSALEGARRGAQQGFTTGGIMTAGNMALNKVPGVGGVLQEANRAADDFRNRYEGGEGGRLERFGNAIDEVRTNAVNQGAKNRLANALTQSIANEAEGGISGDTKFVRLTNDKLQDINILREAQGLTPLDSRQVVAYENALNNNLVNRIREGMTVDDVVNMAYESLVSPQAEALPGNAGTTNTMMVAPYKDRFNSSIIDDFEGTTSLKSIEPRSTNKVNALRQEKSDLLGRPGSPLAANQEGGVTQTSSLEGSTSLGGETTPLRTRGSSIPQGRQNVNTETIDLTNVFEPETRNAITQRNRLQSMGEQLKNAAKTQKYGALYDSLDAKTAARAVQAGAPDTLAKLGVKPENYLEAAKTSNYVNKVVSELAEKSGVKVNVPDMMDRLSADNFDVLMSDTAAKKYNSYIRQIVADGSSPVEYSAGYLLQKSRELGNKAANLRGNTDDVYALRQALTDAKYKLRDLATNALEGAEITGDLTNDNIANGLAKLGANQKIIDYYAEAVDGKAPSISDYIRRSALFEQARDMGTQMEAEKYTRSASKAATGPVAKMWNASGLDAPVNTVLRSVVAPIAGGITKGVGWLTEGAGNLYAGAKNSGTELFNRLGGSGGEAPSPVPTSEGVVDMNYNPQTQIYDIIGRNEGLTNAQQARTEDYINNAVEETAMPTANASSLEQLASSSAGSPTSVYNSVYGTPNATMASSSPQTGYFPQTGDYWTDIIGGALSSAIDDGDVASFAKLYEMYQEQLASLNKNNQSGKDYSDIRNWNSSDRSKYLSAQDGLDQIDMLEQAYTNAVGTGGGNWLQGTLRGMASNILGGNLDPSAANYNKQAESIGMGIVKNMISLGVTEADAKRYLEYLPALTDTKEQAAKKLSTLRDAYQRQINNLYSIYGA